MILKNLKTLAWCGEECIGLALEDLKKDLELVSSAHHLSVKPYGNEQTGLILAGNCREPRFRETIAQMGIDAVDGWEQYSVTVRSDRIIVAGSDKRGAMWGIYAISKMLGVPEGIRMTEVPVTPCEELVNGVYHSKELTYRFRGIFINDEDLLTKWHDSGHVRDIDYQHYHAITAIESLAPIVETALRLNYNLIIPATLMDIDDPYQRQQLEFCVKRGLYVSQHHIEPLGVSHWTFQGFCKKHGGSGELSFVENRENTVRAWRYYVKKWAELGDVVWQLGLRGKADRPVWNNENAKMDKKGWGDLISEAIAAQEALVREACGENFASTVTLWMEGTALFADGLLHLPEKSILVFADVGPTQMLSRDFYETRRDGRPCGMYYHCAYWGDGPHLAPGTDVEKMRYNYDMAVKKCDTAYSVMNVSNMRDLYLTVEANAKIVSDFEAFTVQDYYRAFAEKYFENPEAAVLFPAYFAAYASIPTRRLDAFYGRYFSMVHGEYENFTYYPGNDGFIRYIGLEAMEGKRDPEIEALLVQSADRFTALLAKLDGIRCGEYGDFFRMQILFLILIEKWAVECSRGVQADTAFHREKAKAYLSEYLNIRKPFAVGTFENWYRGDEEDGAKFGTVDLIARTMEKEPRPY